MLWLSASSSACRGRSIITVITPSPTKNSVIKKVSELKQLTATIADMQQRQRDVAALDAKYSRELANAKAENETLRADVAAGRKRLRVNASCSAAVREATGPTSVDNATSPRLADTAERDYFTLRERLMTMQKQLEGAQLYIREQCLR
ncbi:endopeptidase [Escherichia coli]|nr:endopeptidase [Escherichia coli]